MAMPPQLARAKRRRSRHSEPRPTVELMQAININELRDVIPRYSNEVCEPDVFGLKYPGVADVSRHPSLSRSWPPLRARSSRAASRPFRRHFLGRQWPDRRTVNNGAVCVEPRSVTQAVPGALGIVPGHRTAFVGAGRGKGMRLSVVILPHGELLLAVLDDAAFARREFCDAGNTGG